MTALLKKPHVTFRRGPHIGLPEHTLDHGQRIRPGGDEVGAIFRRDAADGNHGNMQLLFRRAQQFEAGAYRLRFGAGRKETAKGDIVRALGLRLHGAREIVVAGHTDNRLRPQLRARLKRSDEMVMSVPIIYVGRVSRIAA